MGKRHGGECEQTYEEEYCSGNYKNHPCDYYEIVEQEVAQNALSQAAIWFSLGPPGLHSGKEKSFLRELAGNFFLNPEACGV